MKGVLNDLLSPADQETLDDIGAVEREITSKDAPGDKFLLVAARGGDDIWIELRRQRAVVRIPQTPRTASADQALTRWPATAPGIGDLVRRPTTPRARAWRRAIRRPSPRRPPAAPTRTSGPAVAAARSARRTRARPSADAPDGSCPRHVPRRRAAPGAQPDPHRGPRAGATPTPRYLGIGRLLRTASARGASSLYLMANARPSIRVDDEILPLETEPPLGTAEVEALSWSWRPARAAMRWPAAPAPSGSTNCPTWAACAA